MHGLQVEGLQVEGLQVKGLQPEGFFLDGLQPEGLTSGGLVGVVQYWQPIGVQGFKVFLPFPPNKQESFATIPGVLHNTPSTPAPAVPTADNGDMHIVVLTLVGIW